MNDELRQQLRELQGDLCGICGRPSPGDLVLDHDHGSGMVRGFLCTYCNGHEGRHPFCGYCPVCEWRITPAVAWLGWTEAYEGWSAWPATNGEHWRPSRLRVREAASASRRAAKLLDAGLDGAAS